MYCSNCGEKVNEGAEVCLKCGHKVKKAEDKQNYNNGFNVQNIPGEYKPISMWGYFGYEILFMIPFIGWIILLIFALGGHSNINVKNFARSYFCLLIIVVILFIIIAALGGMYSAGVSSRW